MEEEIEEVRIPGDLIVDPPIFGRLLTFSKALRLGVILLIPVILAKARVVSLDLSLLLIFLLLGTFFAFFKKDGMPAEKFLLKFFRLYLKPRVLINPKKLR
jgi:hypothetical protein